MKKKKTSKTVPKRQPAPQSRARTKPAAAAAETAEEGLRPSPRARDPRRGGRGRGRARARRRPLDAPVDEVIVLETPEPRFASRVLPPEPDRPFPVSRRAIFFDVENASRPEHIARVIEHLEVDRTGRRTDFVAVGNWRVIGHDTARLLARHGAHLIHSAPSVGVRDWSDLRIAVGAGVWLAGARAGDVLEIITSDRAFDAVGDVAASLGIEFRRLSHQGITGAAETRAPVREAPTESRSAAIAVAAAGAVPGAIGPRRARPLPSPPLRHLGARRLGSTLARSSPWSSPRRLRPSPPGSRRAPAPQTAPRDELIAVVHDLMQRSPGRPLTLDTLANALKSRGFSRPPGSPRLITRLRRIKEIALSRTGVITLVGSHDEVSTRGVRRGPARLDPTAVDAVETPGRGAGRRAPEVDAVPTPGTRICCDADEGPGPGNERFLCVRPRDVHRRIRAVAGPAAAAG